MTVIPETMGLVVPGNMVKRWDAEAKETTLVITSAQADYMVASLTTMKEMFAQLKSGASVKLTGETPAPPLAAVPPLTEEVTDPKGPAKDTSTTPAAKS
jgi:hypothetical protein